MECDDVIVNWKVTSHNSTNSVIKIVGSYSHSTLSRFIMLINSQVRARDVGCDQHWVAVVNTPSIIGDCRALIDRHSLLQPPIKYNKASYINTDRVRLYTQRGIIHWKSKRRPKENVMGGGWVGGWVLLVLADASAVAASFWRRTCRTTHCLVQYVDRCGRVLNQLQTLNSIYSKPCARITVVPTNWHSEFPHLEIAEVWQQWCTKTVFFCWFFF